MADIGDLDQLAALLDLDPVSRVKAGSPRGRVIGLTLLLMARIRSLECFKLYAAKKNSIH